MAKHNIEVKVKTTLWIHILKFITLFKSKRLLNAFKGVSICSMEMGGEKTYFKFEGI